MRKKPALLLINPWIYDFAAYDLFIKPVGLLTLAACLEKAGFEIFFLDCMDRLDPYYQEKERPSGSKRPTGKFHHEVIEKPGPLRSVPRHYKRYGLPLSEVEERLRFFASEKISGVLVTSLMTYWYPGVFDMIRLVKKHIKNTPLFLGGLYVNLLYEHAKELSGADHVIRGRETGTVAREVLKRLEALFPEREPSGEEEPLYSLYRKLNYLVLTLTSGCPFRCSYCASSLLNPAFHVKDLKLVSETTGSLLNAFSIKDIAFYDDALLYRYPEVLGRFLKLFTRPDVVFHTPNGLHVRYISREAACSLYSRGFRTLRLSLESADPDRQKSTGGKVSNNEFRLAVKNLSSAGYSQKDLETYVLFGLPDQNKDEIKRTIDFILDCGAAPKIVEYSLIPGTADHKKYFNNKFIEPLLHNNSVFFTRFSPFSHEDLVSLRQYARV